MYQPEVKPIDDDVRPASKSTFSTSKLAYGIPAKRTAYASRGLQCATEDLRMEFPHPSCFNTFKTNYREMWMRSSWGLHLRMWRSRKRANQWTMYLRQLLFNQLTVQYKLFCSRQQKWPSIITVCLLLKYKKWKIFLSMPSHFFWPGGNVIHAYLLGFSPTHRKCDLTASKLLRVKWTCLLISYHFSRVIRNVFC